MTMISMLKKDHQTVKQLFSQLLEQDEMDPKLLEELCLNLETHMEAEEKFLYPAAEQEIEEPELAKEAELEHKESKALLKAIKSGKLDKTELKVKVEALKLMVEHHVKEEESEFFPQIQESMSQEEMKSIEQSITQLKEKKMASAAKA